MADEETANDPATTTTTSSSFRPGDCVWTSFGAGVIVEQHDSSRRRPGDDDQDDSSSSSSSLIYFSVRLWRVPGKSIASSSLAFLNPSAILERLPAVPGIITSLREEEEEDGETAKQKEKNDAPRVLVHCYYPREKVFLVSNVPPEEDDDEEEEEETNNNKQEEEPLLLYPVSAQQLQPSRHNSSKIYPILEALLHRAEETASATRHVLQSESAQRLVDQTGQAVQDTAGRLLDAQQELLSQPAAEPGSSSGEKGDSATATWDQVVTQTARNAAPVANESLQQVLTMMKDEQLTDLLTHAKERLEELVQTVDLTEKTQTVLAQTGIRISLVSDDESDETANDDSEHQNVIRLSSLPKSAQESRQAALVAINKLLQRTTGNEETDLNAVREELAANFTTAFDSLATAARSDRGLNELFNGIAVKTVEWQQATGRLLQTRSASLFLEGASRLQARAASILRRHNHFGLLGGGSALGDVSAQWTKSFTEADAALARIKSIELGEAVKTRLVQAIEVRSESLGGLDGIIAGALATVEAKTAQVAAAGTNNNNPIQNLLLGLQSNATAVTTDARETLISVLSSKSQYREFVLLRLEQVLCNLESQLTGDDNDEAMTPADIAAIARGQGGTSRIFQPIAKRAMEQIDKQLDAAESQISDQTVLGALERVRKIMSGEMSLQAVMDEVVAVLNNDRVVAAGETLVQHSEQVLDVIENVSGNKTVVDLVERAGISKDTVMREIEKMNVDQLIGTAGSAVTDERARRQLVSSAIDVALDFALRVLPSMPVPPFEGVKDGLCYQISNLSMEGFRVKKEDIQIVLAGMRAVKRQSQVVVPAAAAAAAASSEAKASGNGEDEVMQSGVQMPASCDSQDADESMELEEIETSVKATELLTIEISNISAVLEKAIWSFEQTYMPYLKGNGLANVKMSGGAIRLQFELRRHRTRAKDGNGGDTDASCWEPVLCLHDRSCSIADVELNLEGEGKLTWILNKLAAIFRGPLRDYVVRTIVRVLTNRSGWILQQLNGILSPYWDLILRTAKLNMDDLVEADDAVVVAQQESKMESSLIELVWREQLPLGMNLLTNDESGQLKIVDFPRGSQARAVCEKRNLNPDIFEGATVIGVNGTEYDDSEDLFEALREPGRPKTVRFRLAESEEAERLRQFVEGSKSHDEDEDELAQSQRNRERTLRKVEFTSPGELGIWFGASMDNCALVVKSFLQHEDGLVFAAEKSGKVKIGDVLCRINNENVVGTGKNAATRAVQLLEEVASSRPLSFYFCDPYMHFAQIARVPHAPGVDSSGGPDELILDELRSEGNTRRVVITGFKEVPGMAESSGIFIGDHLVFVNGRAVGAGCRWLDGEPSPPLYEIQNMLQDDSAYPIGLTFARPKQSDGPLRDDQAHTICVTANSRDRIGCLFDETPHGDVVVTDFHGVPGVFQRSFAACVGSPEMLLPLSVDAVNGQFVPSYVSIEMVRNAITRGWKSEKTLGLMLCDDDLKAWIQKLSTDSSTKSN